MSWVWGTSDSRYHDASLRYKRQLVPWVESLMADLMPDRSHESAASPSHLQCDDCRWQDCTQWRVDLEGLHWAERSVHLVHLPDISSITHTYIYRHKQADIYTQVDRHRQTYTHRHSQADVYTDTDRQTYTQVDRHRQADIYTQNRHKQTYIYRSLEHFKQ